MYVWTHSNISQLRAPCPDSPLSALLPVSHGTVYLLLSVTHCAALEHSNNQIFLSKDAFYPAYPKHSTESQSPSEVEAVCKAKDSSVTMLLLFSGPFCSSLSFLFLGWGRERILALSWGRAGCVCQGGLFPAFLLSEGQVCTGRCWAGLLSVRGQSEPECWGLTEAGLTQWPWWEGSHQPRGRQTCTKGEGRVAAGPI